MPVRRIGHAELHIDGTLVTIRPHGSLVPEFAEEIMKIFEQIRTQHGHYYLLVDLRDAAIVPAQLRRSMVEALRSHEPTAAAFFGGSAIARAVNALMLGAFKLINRSPLNATAFRTEQEARAWLDEERQRRQGTAI
jgi:hypothetical protein